MLARERRIYILSKLNQNSAVSISELCAELKVSRSTVQRDLAYLEANNQIVRERGGALKVGIDKTISSLVEEPMSEKLNVNLESKKSIGKMVASKINDSDLVFIDAGTTALYVIPYLLNKKIKIVTYSYLLLSYLKNTDIEVYMLGGEYDFKHDIVSGATTLNNLSEFRFDKAIISAVGVDFNLDEAYTSEVLVGNIKKMAIERAKKTYLIVDDSKFNVGGLYKFNSLSNFDEIIVNKMPKDKNTLKNLVKSKG